MVVVDVKEFVIVLDRVRISSYDATPLLTVLSVTLVLPAGFVYLLGAQASDWSKCAQKYQK